MISLYGVADGNARLARELLIERFPNRAILCTRTFTWVVQHLQDHGTFNVKLTIVAIIGPKESWRANFGTRRRRTRHQHSSTCSWTSSFTVYSASYIKRTRQHLHHVQKCKALETANSPRRVIYCGWLLQQCRERPNFLNAQHSRLVRWKSTRSSRSTISTTILIRSQSVWFLSVGLDNTVSLWKSKMSKNYRRAWTTSGSRCS